jgi:hypothetical protein
MTEEFSYSPDTFPFHSDCYTWPRVAVYDEDGATELNIHCIRDNARRRFILLGFIGIDREEQISQVIHMAQNIDPDAEVIMFKGVGLDDEIINTLMDRMVDGTTWEDGSPDEKLSLMHTDWPTRFQYKILREAMDMRRHGDFHEESLAFRLHAPVEEIHQHLELLTDLGLMEAAE